MILYLRYGPREYWRGNYHRIGNGVFYSMRLIGNLYWTRYTRDM